MRKNAHKRIAVVGAGIFGLTIALKLDERGFSVDVFEQYEDILLGASGANQFRSHRGYHYPRSFETIRSCQSSTPRFEEVFEPAIVKDANRYYAIASDGSSVTSEEYLRVLDEHNLPYSVKSLPWINPSKVSLVIEVTEHTIDIDVLKKILRSRLDKSRIRLFLNTKVTERDVDEYDWVVVAGYGQLNDFFVVDSKYKETYQYELCEKPLVRLPAMFKGTSLVVMDGPFFCFDPYGSTDLHLLGSVDHAIHHREVAVHAHFPDHFTALLNRGLVAKPPVTNIDRFLELIRNYVSGFEHIEHIGSFYTVRSVLPNKENTDERPTIVRKINDRIITVFSGKIGACVDAADEVVARIEESM